MSRVSVVITAVQACITSILCAVVEEEEEESLSRSRIPSTRFFDVMLPHYEVLTRFRLEEAQELCILIGLDPTSTRTGRFKITPFQRFTVFLLSMADSIRLRRLRAEFGWSKDSIRINNLWLTEQIINVLDSPNSPDRIDGWNNDEISNFLSNPSVQLFQQCIGVVDATYIRIQRPLDPLLERRYYSSQRPLDPLLLDPLAIFITRRFSFFLFSHLW